MRAEMWRGVAERAGAIRPRSWPKPERDMCRIAGSCAREVDGRRKRPARTGRKIADRIAGLKPRAVEKIRGSSGRRRSIEVRVRLTDGDRQSAVRSLPALDPGFRASLLSILNAERI